MIKSALSSFCLLAFLASAVSFSSDQKLKTLYNSLDPSSIAEHLAYYELYAPHPLSRQAMADVYRLLSGEPPLSQNLTELPLSPDVIRSLVNLIIRPNSREIAPLEEANLKMIERLSARLSHRRLLGHQATSEAEVVMLPPAQVDVARGLFLSQYSQDLQKVRTYEAVIDLMALQVLARLPAQPTPEQKITKINELIFEELQFRFPPHSLHAKDIDTYTFLPSVLDSHRGVCLGVSILYLCLAQRLDLPLEMITPPGHIYVRYRTAEKTINIETTARGIHIDSEEYLGVNTRSLQQRNPKEVIGLAHFNQASVFWQKGDYEKTYQAYQAAKKYMGEDAQLNELLGYASLFTGHEEEGRQLLHQVKYFVSEHAIVGNTMAQDYLEGNVDAESLKLIFAHDEEDRESLLHKKEVLSDVVKRYPKFRAGLLYLAATWMELYRSDEALTMLKAYQTLTQFDPEANYQLALLYVQRLNYQKAWEHLRLAEATTHTKDYTPKPLKELRKNLATLSPE